MDSLAPEPFTLDSLYKAFSAACKDAWDKGLAERGRPYGIEAIVLPEEVLPRLSQLQNPMDKTLVPVRRTAMFEAGEAFMFPIPGVQQ